MDKVTVEICCGTACYLLGAARLMELEAKPPEELKDKVECEAKACLGMCNDDRLGGAPYVRVNGSEVIANATPDAVLARIRTLLEMEDL